MHQITEYLLCYASAFFLGAFFGGIVVSFTEKYIFDNIFGDFK